MDHLKSVIAKFKSKRLLVVGDIILDQYIYGTVNRISPEAPVPVILQKGRPVYVPGGSANVANNLSSLGAKAVLVGFIGMDAEAKSLNRELKKRKIGVSGIFVDRKRPTSLKTRIIAQHQQVVRLDRELSLRSQDPAMLQRLRKFLKSNIKKFDAVIISDYGKGLITPEVISTVREAAAKRKIIVTVDPKVEHFAYYTGMTAITPNKKETENAVRNIRVTRNVGRTFPVNMDRLDSDADIDRAGAALRKYLKLESLLITLGEQGMRLFEKGKKTVHINTRAREVYDVTGAGDTVIAVFTLSLASGASMHEAADLANVAAGIVVGKMGAVSVSQRELKINLPKE